MGGSDELLRTAKAGTSGLQAEPGRRLVVVTCMDARVDPLPALQLDPGDAHVLRNAGGLVTRDVVRSIIVSQEMLGTVAIDVMMHTRCGMLGLDEGVLRQRLSARAGRSSDMRFHGFGDLTEALTRSVMRLRESPLLSHTGRVRGLVYDVDRGRASVLIP